MSVFTLVRTCPKCHFKVTEQRTVYGDFDGWDDKQRVLPSRSCPYCRGYRAGYKAAKKEKAHVR